MENLDSYISRVSRELEVESLIISDTNGVVLAECGRKLQDLQLLAAVFQSTTENTAKLRIGQSHTVILNYSRRRIIQKFLKTLYVTAVTEERIPLARVLAALDRMERDLSELAAVVAS